MQVFHNTFPALHSPERPSLELGWRRTLVGTLSIGNACCVACGQLIHNIAQASDLGVPAYEYFFEDDAGSPRVAACWPCWHAAHLPDLAEWTQRLAKLYREWHIVTSGEEPGDNNDGANVLHGMAARKLVLGGKDEDAGEDFRRWCRLRLSESCYRDWDGKIHPLNNPEGLAGAVEAYNRGFDFPAPNTWACLAQRSLDEVRPEDRSPGTQDWWRVGDVGHRIGFSLGYNGFNEVRLRFEDGTVAAFTPHQLFPAEQAQAQEKPHEPPVETPTPSPVRESPLLPTLCVSPTALAEIAAVYSGDLIYRDSSIKKPFAVEGVEGLWVCVGSVHKGSQVLSADCYEVVLLSDHTRDTWKGKEYESGYPGRVVTYRKREYVMTDRRLRVVPDESSLEDEAGDNGKQPKKPNLPDEIPALIEIDGGRDRGWLRARSLRVNGKWLHYQLEGAEDGGKGKVHVIGEGIVWRAVSEAVQ